MKQKTTQPRTTTERPSTLVSLAEKNSFHGVKGMRNMDSNTHFPPAVTKNPDMEKEQPLIEFFNQQRNYQLLIDQPYLCGNSHHVAVDMSMTNFLYESDVFLIMVVKSPCWHTKQRSATRSTWANEQWAKKKLGVVVRHAYLLGRCQTRAQAIYVAEEAVEHQDILQWDFHDSFRNITLKEVLFLQWYTSRCRNVPYIYKGDDDVFVNTRAVVRFLLSEMKPEWRHDLMMGSTMNGSPRVVDTKSRYYVSYRLFEGKMYPVYVSGGSFIFSGDLAVRLFNASLSVRMIPIDDAYVGLLMHHLGVKPRDDDRFKNYGRPKVNTCMLSRIFGFHSMSPTMMVDQWQKLEALGDEVTSTCGELAKRVEKVRNFLINKWN